VAEAYGGYLQHVGRAAMPAGSGLGLDGVDVRSAIPEVFHGLEDAGIRIAGLGRITVDGDSLRIYVPLDHGVPCAPTPEHPADGGLWIRATKVNVDRGEIRWYVAMDVGDLVHRMYVDTATTGWSADQKRAALAGRPDVPSSYNDAGVRERLLDTQPDSLREAARMAAERLGISGGAVTSAVEVTASHRKRQEVAAAARAAAASADDGFVAPDDVDVPPPTSETPATDAPPTETPATGAPATETPTSETPATGAPATETPTSETPAPETPATGASVPAAAPATPPAPPRPRPRPRVKQHDELERFFPDVVELIARVDNGELTGSAATDALDAAYRALDADKMLEVKDLIPFAATGPMAVAGETETRLDALAAIHDARERLRETPPSVATDGDSGHYDDGHSFGWRPPETKGDWVHLTQDQTALDELVREAEERMSLEADAASEPAPASTTGPATERTSPSAPPPTADRPSRGKALVFGGIGLLAVLAVAVFAVAAGGSGDDRPEVAKDGETSPAAAVVRSTVPTTPPTTAPKALVSACTLLSADEVGAVVGRPMAAAPAVAGLGCVYTATDKPNIDVTTAYPPYISQVSVSYNAPQPGRTAAQVEELFASTRPSTATDVTGYGARAYSTGTNMTIFADGAMVFVSTSGTLRPQSIPEVQGWAGRIAVLLSDKL
jgi:hypothetical protein